MIIYLPLIILLVIIFILSNKKREHFFYPIVQYEYVRPIHRFDHIRY